jgi:hypothetical protein
VISHTRQKDFHLIIAVQAEPFASMNEFEKLKCAGICSLEAFQHGEVILDGAGTEEKLFMALSGMSVVAHNQIPYTTTDNQSIGSVSVFNFKEAVSLFELEVRNRPTDRAMSKD